MTCNTGEIEIMIAIEMTCENEKGDVFKFIVEISCFRDGVSLIFRRSLSMACSFGNLEVVEYLVLNGVNT